MCKSNYLSVLNIREAKMGSSCFRECSSFAKALMEIAFPAGCMTPGSDELSGKGERTPVSKTAFNHSG